MGVRPYSGPVKSWVAAPHRHQEDAALSDEPPSRRSVRDFCKHYGLTRNQYLIARGKAKVRPKAWDAVLSGNDVSALLRYVSAEKRADQIVRQVRQRPTVTKRFVPPPPPSIDYEAEMARITKSLDKWRATLIELAQGHTATDAAGRCTRCHVDAPCLTKQTLARLDNELVEQIAIADSGDQQVSAAGVVAAEPPPDWRLRQLYAARNRWRAGLTKLTIDHMLEDNRGRCTKCGVAGPCDTKKTVMRINKGIARQIEKFAAMDDQELEVALGNRPLPVYEDDDWNAM